ncbi:MAG: DUF2460 domain-containing protein [Candidatus Hodarchaeales archaeon]
MVSDYTTITKVRSETGHRPEKEYKEEIGTGDGSTTEFDLGFISRDKRHYLVSRDQAGSVSSADLDVYVDDVKQSTSSYSIDADEGTIIFDSAPNNGTTIKATYWHSYISDDEIENQCIAWAMDFINRVTQTSYYTDGDSYESTTDTWDGDGNTTSFRLSKGRIIAVTSYNIDGTTSGLTENTDYYLYPKQRRIVFETPPANDHRNVSITYTYGTPINGTVQELATILASIKALSLTMGRTGLTGSVDSTRSSRRSYKSTTRYRSQLNELYSRAEYLFTYLGCKIEVSGIG